MKKIFIYTLLMFFVASCNNFTKSKIIEKPFIDGTGVINEIQDFNQNNSQDLINLLKPENPQQVTETKKQDLSIDELDVVNEENEDKEIDKLIDILFENNDFNN